MGRLRKLLRFTNRSDLRRAVSNPRRAARAVRTILAGQQSDHGVDRAVIERTRRTVLGRLFDTDPDRIGDLLDEFRESDAADDIAAATGTFADRPYSTGGWLTNGETLYAATRLLRPRTVLEVGVANGFSTAHLLAALDHADVAASVSAIDLPKFEHEVRERRGKRGLAGGAIIPDDKAVGWVADPDLRRNYGFDLHVGDFTHVLQPLLDRTGEVDLFVYHASMDRADMQFALEAAVDSLAEGGLLVSGYAQRNDAFENATRSVPGRTGRVHTLDLFRKA